MTQPKRLFHYTVGLKLPSIQADGFLKTTPTEPKLGERPLVWLSSNPEYEHTARKHLMGSSDTGTRLGSLSEMDQYCHGVYRFCFPLEVLTDHLSALPWPVLKTRSRMRKRLIDRLVKRAKGVKAKPMDWYGVMAALPIERATLERLDLSTGQWVETTLESASATEPAYKVEQILDNKVPTHLRARDEHWTD
jgi:hypothetical protein